MPPEGDEEALSVLPEKNDFDRSGNARAQPIRGTLNHARQFGTTGNGDFELQTNPEVGTRPQLQQYLHPEGPWSTSTSK